VKFPLFDAHCDTLSAMYAFEQPLLRNNLHVDLERGRKYAPQAQFFAIFGELGADLNPATEGFPHWERGGQCFAAQYNVFQRALETNRDKMAFCRTATDAGIAAQGGQLAAYLSVEGAEILDCSVEKLREAHQLGVRMVGLTWNVKNTLSGTSAEATAQGLTEQGRRFVQECQALGVIVDVSHLSVPGFWDVAEMLTVPFVASHSNAYALCPHSRNLTDDQFCAIVKAGGVAGINLFNMFLGENPDIDTVVAHIEHFLALGGGKSIAMGADLDGCDQLPQGINGIEDMEKLAERLLQKNYPETLVADMFYHNLMRVVEQVCVI